jgi:hypothetical protein
MKIMTAAQFIRENTQHLKGVTDEALIESEMKRAFVNFVRSDIPLDDHDRCLIAGTLKDCFFPNPRQRKAALNLFKARFHQDAIRDRAAANKAAGKPKPVAEAEEFVAQCVGMTVDAMKQQIKRAKRAHAKKGQKL